MADTLLSLNDGERITRWCSTLALQLSEFNFANLYLFRYIHQYQLIEENPSQTYLQGVSYQGHQFLMPLFHPRSWPACVEFATKLGVDYVYPIPEAWFPEVYSAGYPIRLSDDDSDYVYDAETVRTLHGRHLDGHRNLVRSFLSDHDVKVVPLNSSSQIQAHAVVDLWAQAKRGVHGVDDVKACHEGIDLADKLGLDGWVYEIDGSASGLLLGGPLTDSIYLYHFSKTSQAHRGLPSFMHHDAAKRINVQYRFLNWEQDLGIEGLRHSKQSFHPKMKVPKGQLWIS